MSQTPCGEDTKGEDLLTESASSLILYDITLSIFFGSYFHLRYTIQGNAIDTTSFLSRLTCSDSAALNLILSPLY